MREQIRIIILGKLDPAGGAGGDHGQHAAVFHPLDQLVGLFDNGHVGAEVGVEHLVKAQAA